MTDHFSLTKSIFRSHCLIPAGPEMIEVMEIKKGRCAVPLFDSQMPRCSYAKLFFFSLYRIMGRKISIEEIINRA